LEETRTETGICLHELAQVLPAVLVGRVGIELVVGGAGHRI